MKTRNLVSLLLALIMVLSVVPMAVAEELPTLKVYCIDTTRKWDPTVSNQVKIMETVGCQFDITLMSGEQINMAIGAGDLPDVIVFSGMEWQEYVSTGYLRPLDELLAKHGSNITALTTEKGKALSSVGGVQYVYPYENNNSKYFTYIRKDWLDALNFDLSIYTQVEDSDIYNIPLDDYAKMLEAFTFNDPDGNGKNDTYGLSFNGNTTIDQQFMAFYGAFGGQMTQYYEKDGAVYAFETSDEYRAALEYLNGLWEKGVIDPEAYILKGDQAKSNMINGKSGSFAGWWSASFELIRDGMWDIDADAEWITANIVGPDGKSGMRDNGLMSCTTAITTACKDPEFAMQVLNKLNEEEVWWMIRWGIEGEHYTKDENGYPTRTEEGARLHGILSLDTLYPLTNCITYENFANSGPASDPQSAVRRTMLVHQFVKAMPLYTSLFYGMPATQESMDYSVDVKNCVETNNMQFVTGAKELNDETWAAYKKAWASMGGAEVMQSYIDAYNATNGTSLVAAE